MKCPIVISSALALGAAVPAAAQAPEPARAAMFVTTHPAEQGFGTIRVDTAFESRATTGRPYAAEAVTEFVHALGDGNRIARRTSVRVFRDGEGRTRREDLGPNDAPASITIYDPVTHTSYVLDPAARTAHKSGVRIIYPPAFAGTKVDDAPGAGVAGRSRIGGAVAGVPHTEMAVQVVPDPGARGGAAVKRGGFVSAIRVGGPVEWKENATVEALGEQTIEGVTATGTRTTTVIPAGAIGNQQEIRIVSEEWFSTELEALVMTKHSDPRSGETIYRLTNIIKGEPGAGLFEVPADYTIKDSSFVPRKD